MNTFGKRIGALGGEVNRIHLKAGWTFIKCRAIVLCKQFQRTMPDVLNLEILMDSKCHI